MRMRMKLYQHLVNRVPAIQKEYWRRRKLHTKPTERVLDWCALLGMNLAWSVGYRSWAARDWEPDAKRILPKKAESSLHPKLPPEEFAKKLLEYDVISFDVFDTLVLRPFERPTDLFHVVGARLEYLDFARLRAEAEAKARRLNYKIKKTYEVTLEEIWEVLKEDTGIPKEEGMAAEIETELAYCFGNPYMKAVFRCLKAEKQKAKETGEADRKQHTVQIICTSDMYLPSEVIGRLLNKCGFSGIEQIYVSCEQGASKSDGSLYRKIRSKLEESGGLLRPHAEEMTAERRLSPLTFFHTGDNRVSDVEKAREAGWEARHYPNVNDLGEWYRARDLSLLTGSLYRGIVNAHIYNGLHTYSREYELGYLYGGLFVTGYCQWIHRYVIEQEIDKILFLARDGDVLYQVYRKLYPKEADIDRTEYVYWSRKTATKLGAAYFKYDFFRRFLHHKVNQGYTLREIFQSMELEELLAGCLKAKKSADKEIANKRQENLTENTELTSSNAEWIETYLKAHWQEVLNSYQGQREAAGKYYQKVLSGHKKVAAVDVGWAGSGAVVLQYLARKEWQLDCEIIGLLAGTNSAHNGFEKDTAEGLRYLGKQASYLFSQEHNRQIWKFHDAAKGHNLLWELLLSSPEGSLKGFYPTQNADASYEIRLGNMEAPQAEAVREIQRGILDFAGDWMRLEKAEGELGLWEKGYGSEKAKERCHEISGADVYAVVRVWEREKNMDNLKEWFDQEGI